MAYILADNILSPLGTTTQANVEAVLQGRSAVRVHRAEELGVGADFAAALMERQLQQEGYSWFESKILVSVQAAITQLREPLPTERTVLIVSSTKGDVEHLATGGRTLAESAQRVAQALRLTTPAVCVSNACVSGLSALILAQRLLDSRRYDYAIVCGSDDIGRFVVSGFQSLLALSAQDCRPFDIERTGLALGEAAATLVLAAQAPHPDAWQLAAGAVHNDAYHLTAPSKQAEGAFRCLKQLTDEQGEPDFINLHGTGTLFNDPMEAKALQRAALSHVPANALKGCFGHTLGAAGLIETIISIHCAEQQQLPATLGFSQTGVSAPVNISDQTRPTPGRRFIKMLSGFGGVNAAAYFMRGEACAPTAPHTLRRIARSRLTPGRSLDELYKESCNYPRFHRMDTLSKLAFLAAEQIRDQLPADEECAIVLFTQHGSLHADRSYYTTIRDAEDYYPSPALFIRTLPNIATGELAIRLNSHGETALYVLPQHNPEQERDIVEATASTRYILAGWADYQDEQHYLCDLALYENNTL